MGSLSTAASEVGIAAFAGVTGKGVASLPGDGTGARKLWMLAMFAVSGLGPLTCVLFGRGRKAFSPESRLLRVGLSAARPLPAP